MKTHEEMINWLEIRGFILWYDDESKKWAIFPSGEIDDDLPSGIYSLVEEDKLKVIEQAFNLLAR